MGGGAGLTLAFLAPDQRTWQEVTNEMPYTIKQDIAITFCAQHRRMCRTIPRSIPGDLGHEEEGSTNKKGG
jgi:hypothetical protein